MVRNDGTSQILRQAEPRCNTALGIETGRSYFGCGGVLVGISIYAAAKPGVPADIVDACSFRLYRFCRWGRMGMASSKGMVRVKVFS